MQFIRSAHQQGASSIQGSKTFTGTAYIDPVFASADNGGCFCANVTFLPGARTFWHTHEKGQILSVTNGEGLICTAGEEPKRLRVGDVVYIPGGEKHWHGATATSIMTHMAIAMGGCEWHEEVDAEEYEKINSSG
ncbi:unnamed protein product [Zymoseptoria tritici ST99CH_1A5]|uniref:Cupin type-2 domain-containing protein n=4 Tax=Zymoseptoria tritici TaxID=1047171 RepID=F9WWF3_ZYMTI|nr:uncharacterized protein MYCGRDRAFT_89270 [Zymoseptoria tritici IPO323]SMQ45736.1 unnamed protein product [Zymoseptoria tritici ST99CH_3D7]SMR42081.1 unnamed protein product [Zymoseptoria tritici ST99CH_1E4]SMR44263.1 unnamed protein product [Zymoseptoria tritici ST99CH_3D1]SMY19417.1 unnamed protein product [Zymoseptoria tritici ST99CH_1A5]EGP92413.1 hypothetical protein MYCGRDRAFT_89270 [Zymoseptoria tritici IPO323]